MFNISY